VEVADGAVTSLGDIQRMMKPQRNVGKEGRNMTQGERLITQRKAIMDFMEANKRLSPKFMDSEKGLRNRWKHQQKLVNAGELRPERVETFRMLMELGGIRGLISIFKIESC
jgi:hypothetical protein